MDLFLLIIKRAKKKADISRISSPRANLIGMSAMFMLPLHKPKKVCLGHYPFNPALFHNKHSTVALYEL